MWTVTMTWPDLSYSAHKLTKFSEHPEPTPYLWHTKEMGMGITYEGDMGIDVDYGTHPDTRCSVSGGAVVMGKCAISWFSRIKKVTWAASFESE